MNKKDFKIGQTVYFVAKEMGNAYRTYKDQILEGKITKIGNKYFDHDNYRVNKINIETMQNDAGGYCIDWDCYISKEAIENKIKSELIIDKIAEFGESWYGGFNNLSLNQLERILKIIEEKS